jgi:hypothetical protein
MLICSMSSTSLLQRDWACDGFFEQAEINAASSATSSRSLWTPLQFRKYSLIEAWCICLNKDDIDNSERPLPVPSVSSAQLFLKCLNGSFRIFSRVIGKAFFKRSVNPRLLTDS